MKLSKFVILGVLLSLLSGCGVNKINEPVLGGCKEAFDKKYGNSVVESSSYNFTTYAYSNGMNVRFDKNECHAHAISFNNSNISDIEKHIPKDHKLNKLYNFNNHSTNRLITYTSKTIEEFFGTQIVGCYENDKTNKTILLILDNYQGLHKDKPVVNKIFSNKRFKHGLELIQEVKRNVNLNRYDGTGVADFFVGAEEVIIEAPINQLHNSGDDKKCILGMELLEPRVDFSGKLVQRPVSVRFDVKKSDKTPIKEGDKIRIIGSIYGKPITDMLGKNNGFVIFVNGDIIK